MTVAEISLRFAQGAFSKRTLSHRKRYQYPFSLSFNFCWNVFLGAFDWLLFSDGDVRVCGQYAPKRGYYLSLGDREMLLFLAGPDEVKRPENGMPRPLLLILHPDSTLTDMDYLTHQVFAFSCNSLRTFLPISLPVTIQYPNLIADLLGKLSHVPGWNPNVLLGKIGKDPFFL
jgi:hypothetical protein